MSEQNQSGANRGIVINITELIAPRLEKLNSKYKPEEAIQFTGTDAEIRAKAFDEAETASKIMSSFRSKGDLEATYKRWNLCAGLRATPLKG